MSEVAQVSDDHPLKPELEHAFTISIKLGGIRWVQPTSRGETRAAVYAAEGSVEGPLLKGKVIPIRAGTFRW